MNEPLKHILKIQQQQQKNRSCSQSTMHFDLLTNHPRLQLLQGRQPQLKDLKQTNIPKTNTGLPMLRQGAASRGYIQLLHQLIQNLESQDTMVDGGLQELGNILGQLAMRGVIEPSEFGNATDQLDEGGNDKVLQRGALVGKVGEDVVADVDALGDGEVVPVGGDEVRERIGGDESGVVRG